MNFDNLKRQVLGQNCRSNSLEHALRLIEDENKNVLVELGTARTPESNNFHEGLSTVLLSALSMIHDKKFYSIDNMQESVNASKSILKTFENKLLNFVEYRTIDQKVFLDELDEKIDFIYIDAAEKSHMISYCLNKLNDGAIILVDDMTEPWQREACVDAVNRNVSLSPIDKIDFFPHNNQEIKYQNLLNSEMPSNNFSVHSSGVQQYPIQLLLRFDKSKFSS